MNLRPMFLAALLLACSDERGQLGNLCKPDGTCIGPNLECVSAANWAGIPIADAVCVVKEKR